MEVRDSARTPGDVSRSDCGDLDRVREARREVANAVKISVPDLEGPGLPGYRGVSGRQEQQVHIRGEGAIRPTALDLPEESERVSPEAETIRRGRGERDAATVEKPGHIGWQVDDSRL